MAEAAVALQHHNQPPADANPLRDRLMEDHAALVKRAIELSEAVERAPETVDENNAGRVADFVKQITGHMKALDGARVAEKEPYLAGGRTVDGFFKTWTDALEKGKRAVEAKLNVYLRRKAEEERRRREEAERIAREEAERAARAAAEAAAKAQTDADLNAAIVAEDAAIKAAADAAKAAQAADAKPADMARTRGDYGAVGTLRREWVFDDLDRNALDLEALRPFIPQDAIEKAIRAFIRSGGRQLAGVRIYETETTMVR